MEMTQSIESMFANIKAMDSLREKMNGNKEIDWHDTIIELLSFGDYTLIQYYKGGEMEWNVAHHYDRESKSWANGNYCYSLASALAMCLDRMDSEYVKSVHQLNVERKFGITFDRMSEIATNAISNIEDEDSYFYYDTCLTEKEMEYFEIKRESEEE